MAGRRAKEARLRWYEVEVLVADLTGHRHAKRGVRAEEIEARMIRLYSKTLTFLVSPEYDGAPPPDRGPETEPGYLLVASFPAEPAFGRSRGRGMSP